MKIEAALLDHVVALRNSWEGLSPSVRYAHILALREAGWSIRRIGREIAKNEGTVRYALKKGSYTDVQLNSVPAEKPISNRDDQEGSQSRSPLDDDDWLPEVLRERMQELREEKARTQASGAVPPRELSENEQTERLVQAFVAFLESTLSWPPQFYIQLIECVRRRILELEFQKFRPVPPPPDSDLQRVIAQCQPKAGNDPFALEIRTQQMAVALLKLAPSERMRNRVVATLLNRFDSRFPLP